MKRELKMFFGVLVLSLLGTPGTSLGMPLATMPTTMYVLGDSLSDVGNLLIATSAATPPNPLPQPADYFQGRFSNGPIYAEYLWTNLGLQGDLSPSLAGGTNYAFGGARSRYHAVDVGPNFDPLVDPSSVRPFTLLGQRDAFLTQAGPALDPGALYTVWIGSNDVGDAIALGAVDPIAALALMAQSADDFLAVIQDLVAAGARDLLIPKVPDLGLVPRILQLGSPQAQLVATEFSQKFNQSVDAGLAGIGGNIIRFDTFQFLTDLVADPTQFGLPAGLNTTETCFDGFVGVPGTVCQDPENRLFWDEIHPSALAHEVLGAEVTAAVVPEPAAIMLIALALAALGLQRRQRGIANRFLFGATAIRAEYRSWPARHPARPQAHTGLAEARASGRHARRILRTIERAQPGCSVADHGIRRLTDVKPRIPTFGVRSLRRARAAGFGPSGSCFCRL